MKEDKSLTKKMVKTVKRSVLRRMHPEGTGENSMAVCPVALPGGPLGGARDQAVMLPHAEWQKLRSVPATS